MSHIAGPPLFGEGPASWQGGRGGNQHQGDALAGHPKYSAAIRPHQGGLTWGEVLMLTGGRRGVSDHPCPRCGPSRQSTRNRFRPVLRIWVLSETFASYCCPRCLISGWAIPDERQPRRFRRLQKGRSNADPEPTAQAARRNDWQRLWQEARALAGTPAEQYLLGRGLSLPPDANEVLRWHPACPFGGARTGCLLAEVRSVLTDQPMAIHRTAISEIGEKVSIDGLCRRALGPTKGGAIKVSADTDVGTCLGIGEGLETTLTIRLHPDFSGVPIWSLIDAGHLRAFPVLPGVEGLIVAVDHDAAGEVAANTVAERYQAAGVAVTLVRAPEMGADLNDLVRGR